MNALGPASLLLAGLAALYAAGAGLYGARGDRRWVDSSRRAVYAFAALLTLCVAILELAFLRDDFSLALVADHSSTTTPTFYKLTALWSSQAGSLLLWAWVLSLFSSAVVYVNRRRHPEIVPYATAVLMGLGAFFVGLMWFGAHPFARLDPAPIEGVGLTPLLRHPMMAVHPPMLYSGYVAFSIPFAFAIGALITRRVDASWIRSTRLYALLAWIFLGLGLILGSRWGYSELGWGGYWAWDPVENAALMPWLTGTAFLHSIMVQERRGMLRVWNVSLIVAAFALALFGTLLVRSGVLQSIHAFGASTVGGPILALISVVLLGSTILIVSRLDDLRSERRIDSLLSREAVFLVNNLLLVGLSAVILWGTLFPLIAEAVTGTRSSLATPWFNRYTAPLAILVVLFTGIGPLVAWRRVSWPTARRVFLWPTVAGLLVGAAAFGLTDARGEPLALLLFAFAAFALAGLAQEFARGTAARRALAGERAPVALWSLVTRNRRRYGGYVVHVGVATMLIGIAVSSSFQTKRDVRLDTGERATVAGYTVRYLEPTVDVANERIEFGARLDVRRDGERVARLNPSRRYFRSQDLAEGPIGRFFAGEATSEVGMKTGPSKDFWVAMQPNLSQLERPIAIADRRLADTSLDAQGLAIVSIAQSYRDDPPSVTFRVLVNPGALWLYVGGLIALGGGLVAAWPTPGARRRRVSAAYAARLGRELSRA